MRALALLVAKDLRVEWHNRRRLLSLLLFGAALAVVVGYSYRTRADLPATLPTLIWMLTVFLQLIFLGQSYQAEVENSCFDGLRLSPVPRWRIGLAKVLADVLLVSLADVLVLAMVAFLTGTLEPLAPGLLLLLAIETVGVISLGNLLFGCTAAGESPAIDLYALVLLLSAPLILFGPDAAHGLFEGHDPARLSLYFLFLGVYALALLGVAAVAYKDFIKGS